MDIRVGVTHMLFVLYHTSRYIPLYSSLANASAHSHHQPNPLPLTCLSVPFNNIRSSTFTGATELAKFVYRAIGLDSARLQRDCARFDESLEELRW